MGPAHAPLRCRKHSSPSQHRRYCWCPTITGNTCSLRNIVNVADAVAVAAFRGCSMAAVAPSPACSAAAPTLTSQHQWPSSQHRWLVEAPLATLSEKTSHQWTAGGDFPTPQLFLATQLFCFAWSDGLETLDSPVVRTSSQRNINTTFNSHGIRPAVIACRKCVMGGKVAAACKGPALFFIYKRTHQRDAWLGGERSIRTLVALLTGRRNARLISGRNQPAEYNTYKLGYIWKYVLWCI